jgi:hypothetical protein
MKKIKWLFVTTTLALGFAACNVNNKETAKTDAGKLIAYVDSIQSLIPLYTDSFWVILNNGYQERALRAEKSLSDLTAADKQQLQLSKAKFEKLKESYTVNIKLANEKNGPVTGLGTPSPVTGTKDYRSILRKRLFGEGIIGSDMKINNVTAANLLNVYSNFVNTVADNRNNYTREDWDEIKVLYEALDTRKNAVEKDLKAADNLKIAGLKVRFASIKGVHRSATKGPENEAVKN